MKWYICLALLTLISYAHAQHGSINDTYPSVCSFTSLSDGVLINDATCIPALFSPKEMDLENASLLFVSPSNGCDTYTNATKNIEGRVVVVYRGRYDIC